MFTGKAKELFEKYLINNLAGYKPYTEICIELPNGRVRFNDLPLSMQIGVIEDFAESLGYLIDKINYGNRIDIKVYKKNMSIIQVIRVKDTTEARKELINQLNELINDNS